MASLKKPCGYTIMSERNKNEHRRLRHEFGRLVIAYQHLMTHPAIDLIKRGEPTPQTRYAATLLKQLLQDLDIHVRLLEHRAPTPLSDESTMLASSPQFDATIGTTIPDGRPLSKEERVQLEIAGAGTFAHLLRDSRRMLILAREQIMPLLTLAEANDEMPRAISPAPTEPAATIVISTVIEINDYRPRDEMENYRHRD